MAVYKIFPEKSATIYSFYPTLNTGLDEILEISTFTSINDTNEVSRVIIKFPTDEINDIINNKVSGSIYDAYLKLYLANASSLPVNYTLYCYPISGSWESGTGRLGNVPITTDGASWGNRNQLNGINWFNSNTFPTNTTGSFTSGSNSGGGLWYTGSYEATQSFTNITSKDIEIKVTTSVNAWISSSIENNGLIIKHSDVTEFSNQSKFETKYFSGNTHTIYPPCLEIKWDDSSYITGSLSIINSDKIVANFINNKDKYQQDSIQRFRINVRDQFPIRSFQTSSVYLNNKLLPITSYWSIKDLDTEEIIVDYDLNYTKISADENGNYFDIYMNGLEPERNYKVLIKTIINNNTLILDNNYYFKVIR
jgi:hypothetical protein